MITIVPNGVTDLENLTLTCDDTDIVLTVNADGTRTATLPNKTATYRFLGTYREAGCDYSAEYTFTVAHAHEFGAAEQHNEAQHKMLCDCGEPQYEDHDFGAAEPHNEAQHKMLCDCGEPQYEDHDFGAWTETKPATEEEDGKKERTCPCGFVDEETIPKLEKQPDESNPSDEDDDTDTSDKNDQNGNDDNDNDNDNANTDTDTDTDTETKKPTQSNPPSGSNGNAASGDPFGCSVSIVGSGTLLLCAIASLVMLRKRED